MFQGAYTSYEPVCDYGAKRTLNMGGSLLGYIQTGNPYDKNYYRKQCKNDTFEKTKSPRKTIDKIITAGVLGAAAIAGGFLLLKKTKIPCLVNLRERLTDLTKDFKPSEAISNAKAGFDNLKKRVLDPEKTLKLKRK